MNRYSRVQPSQFDPLSLQEIMAVPLARQKTHDNSLQAIDELGLFDINRLQKDDEAASRFINEYTDKLQSRADQILERGVDQSTVREMMKLKSERDKFLQNDGKKMQAAYNKRMEDEKLIKSRIGKDLSATRAQEILKYGLDNYQGISNGEYNSYYGAAQVDASAKADEIGKSMPDNIVSANSGLQPYYTSDGEMFYRYSDTSIASKDPLRIGADGSISQSGLVRQNITQRLLSDPSVQEDIAHMKRVDPTFDEREYLEPIIENATQVWQATQEKTNVNYMQSPRESSSRSKSGSDDDNSNGLAEVNSNTQFAKQYNEYSDLEKKAKEDIKNGIVSNESRAYKRFEQTFKNSDYYKRKQESIMSDIMKNTGNKLELSEVRNLIDSPSAKIEKLSDGNYYMKSPVDNKLAKISQEFIDYQIANRSDVNSAEDIDYRNVFTSNGIIKSSSLGKDEQNEYIGSFKSNDLNDIEEYKMAEYAKFASPETAFIFTDMKPAERTAMNENLKATLNNAVNNFELLELETSDTEGSPLNIESEFYDQDKSEASKMKISRLMDQADKLEFVNTGVDNRTNKPYIRVKFNRKDEEKNENGYVVKIGIDSLTGKSGVQSGESEILRLLQKHGGDAGSLVAQRLQQKIIYQNENINYSQDEFNGTSNYVKEDLMSPDMNRKFESVFGKNFDVNLYENEDGKYVMQSKSEGEKNGKFISWGDIVSPTNINLSKDNMSSRDSSIQTALMQYAIENQVLQTQDIMKADGTYNTQAIEEAFNNILQNPQLHKLVLGDKYLLYDMLKDY